MVGLPRNKNWTNRLNIRPLMLPSIAQLLSYGLNCQCQIWNLPYLGKGYPIAKKWRTDISIEHCASIVAISPWPFVVHVFKIHTYMSGKGGLIATIYHILYRLSQRLISREMRKLLCLKSTIVNNAVCFIKDWYASTHTNHEVRTRLSLQRGITYYRRISLVTHRHESMAIQHPESLYIAA